ncbi:MAG: hypothetical protein IH959_02585 [Chloroflexi bacterium]|nr:hypothetical protein [Chloroflexota bacterium]
MSDDHQRYTEALSRFSGDLRMAQHVYRSMQDRGVEPQAWRRAEGVFL